MSVRKRSWKTRQGEDRAAWVLDYRDREGKRHIETFTKKKEADARAAEVLTEIRAGTHVPRNASITVAEAGENWIARAKADRLERGTIAQYRQHLDIHIAPRLGAVKLADLSGPDVAKFERDLHGAGASGSMRRKVLVSLSSLLRQATRTGHVNRNAAEGARVKASKRGRKRLEIGRDIPTVEEIRAVLNAAKPSERAFFMTAIFTGMRASELRGLSWQNVDLDSGEIHIRERADAYHVIGWPKSSDSYRTLPIGPQVVNTLQAWRLSYPRPIIGQDADGEPVREDHKSEHLVFPTRTGGVQSASNIRKRQLHPLMLRAGVALDTGEKDRDGEPVPQPKYSGLHSLRHFYASWLINPVERGGQGLPPKVVQERMGHSTLAMTMDVYGHLFPRGDDADQIRDAEAALLAVVG